MFIKLLLTLTSRHPLLCNRKEPIMKLYTISQVSKSFHVSTRTLRYYEEIGILPSIKKEDYEYRAYDNNSLIRLQQIIILRKLRIPLKQISDILKNNTTISLFEVFQLKMSEIENEIASLSTIKSILSTFLEKLNENMTTTIDTHLLGDEAILKICDTLSITKINQKADMNMDSLVNAEKDLSTLKDVRITYLPPATVASIHCIGENPELNSGRLLNEFIRTNNLATLKPDFRHYGFNHLDSNMPDGNNHGYERYVTIPDDMEVMSPFVKKHFCGGLYAAHMIPMGAFEEWEWIYNWVKNSPIYDFNFGDPECMNGSLEEHLNYINLYMLSDEDLDVKMQLDLLIPIKEK